MRYHLPGLGKIKDETIEGQTIVEQTDLPEPWQVVPYAAQVLRSGGMYLSFVPTVPQVVQTVEALEQAMVFGMVETFETLLRTWSIQGRSVRPDHRMVAHSGFITVARKIESGLWPAAQAVEAVGEATDAREEREDHAP